MSDDCRCAVCTAEREREVMGPRERVEKSLRDIEKKINVIVNENHERLNLLHHERDRLKRLISHDT